MDVQGLWEEKSKHRFRLEMFLLSYSGKPSKRPLEEGFEKWDLWVLFVEVFLEELLYEKYILYL